MNGIVVALTCMGYLGAALFSVAQLYAVRWGKWARGFGWLGFISESFWFIEKGVAIGGLPIITLYDWVSFFVWLAAGLYLVASDRLGLAPVGAFLFPIIFLVWLVSQSVSPRITMDSTSIMGIGLLLHIVLATLGDVCFLLSAVFGIMYVEKERELKNKKIRLFYYQLPALGDMDGWGGKLVLIGWIVFSLALLTGAWWAHVIGLSFWHNRVQIVGAGVEWLVYLGYLATRYVAHWQGHRAAVFVMLAFIIVLMNVFGINLVFPGPHNTNF